jgi:hypothetical protein
MVTYEQAKSRFEATKKPPRSKKYSENQRPLRRVQENWLMLEKDNDSYVYKINGSEVATLYPPNEQGECEVGLRWNGRSLDLPLLYKFVGTYHTFNLENTNGEQVVVPLNPSYDRETEKFSALLTFNSSHKLIVEKSKHYPVFILKSTGEDKAKRQKLKKELEAYITLQMFKLASLKNNCNATEQQGRPFGESGLSYGMRAKMKEFLRQDVLPLESQEFAMAFDDVAQHSFNMLASKRVWNNSKYTELDTWRNRNDPAIKADLLEIKQDIIQAITEDDMKTSLVTELLNLANLKAGSEYVPLPQFANKLPRKYFYIRQGKPQSK